MVQNADAQATRVRLTFSGPALPAPLILTDRVPAGAARHYWQGTTPAGLPDGFVGSAVAESLDGRRLAAAVHTANARGHFAACRGVPAPPEPHASGVRLFAPALYNGYSPVRWESSFVVQNVDTTAAPAEIDYTDPIGTTVLRVTATLAPGATLLRYLPAEALPPGFRGAALAHSGGG